MKDGRKSEAARQRSTMNGFVFGNRRKIATCAAAGLALAVGYHVVFGNNGLTAYQTKRQDAQSLNLQLHTLSRENDALKGHVDRLQSDPNAIEHQAREELHYTRPGEVIVTLAAEGSAAEDRTNVARQNVSSAQ